MKRIPSLFVRDEAGRATSTVEPSCLWVSVGEGRATRQFDGVCVMTDGLRWWMRHEVDLRRALPEVFMATDVDRPGRRAWGWVPAATSWVWAALSEALRNDARSDPWEPWVPGTFELIGPDINGNPEGYPGSALVRHEVGYVFHEATMPRDFEGLRARLTAPDFRFKGVVWHHPDGRLAKVRRQDFA